MDNKNEFYTLTGYKLLSDQCITAAMEDYLEMIYRLSLNEKFVTIKMISDHLHVRPSSVTKMCQKLVHLGFICMERYGSIYLSVCGEKIGSYLLWRHSLLERLLRFINGKDFSLKQVEKIEHFVDDITLNHIEKFLIEFDKTG